MNDSEFILSKKKALKNFSEIEKISDFISYSSKTNPIISKILEKETNCFFSIHLKNELKNIKNKKRIIYLAQGWDEKEIKRLIQKKITNFVLDNTPDLELLKKIMKKRKEKLNLYLRLKLKENTLKTEKYFVFGFNSKYILKEIPKLKELPWIKNIGIHFHRKTQNISEWNYKNYLLEIFPIEFFKQINKIIIGGGLPGIYRNTNLKIFEPIFNKIKEFKTWLNSLNIEMGIEPGRYIAASSIKLKTKIKTIYDNNIIVDASVYNSDLDALIVPVKLLIEGEVEKNEGKEWIIKGKTPCSMDLFRYRVYLKKDPKPGDFLIFLNAGAYNFHSDFCNLEKIPTRIVK